MIYEYPERETYCGFDSLYRRVWAEAERKNRAYAVIMATGAIGIEYRKRTLDQWAFICSEMSDCDQGSFRVQEFDARGFMSHVTKKTLLDAIKTLIDSGYVIADPGTLDRLSVTPTWQKGSALISLIMQVNAGEISHNEYCKLSAEICKKYDHLLV